MHDNTTPIEAERPTTLETLPPPGPHQRPVAPPVAWPAGYSPNAHPATTQPSSRPGLVLGIISLIASSLALLGVIGLFAWTFTSSPMGLPPDDFGPPPAPLTGQLSSVPNGGQVTAADLTGEIADRLEKDGWLVEDMRCPQVTGLAQGTVSVCHATLDDGDWAVIIFFEDSKGTYTLSLV